MTTPDPMPAPGLVVFADLDGTILDRESYSAKEAEPGLALLRARGARLVACTSKTAAELIALAPALGLEGPAIAENGSVIAWRLGAEDVPEVLGTPYARLRDALATLRQSLALPLVGFGDVGPREIAERAGLPIQAAVLAGRRLADEPFWSERALSARELDRLAEAARALGLRLERGDRFHHLVGAPDKGSAARRVLESLRATGTRLVAAAVGDSANDRSLLEAVERAFAVRGSDGAVDPALGSVSGVTVARAIGPAGFSECVRALLAVEGSAAGRG